MARAVTPVLGFWAASARPSSRRTSRRGDSPPLAAAASRRQRRSRPWRGSFGLVRINGQRRSGGAGREDRKSGGDPSGGLGKGANSQVGSGFGLLTQIRPICEGQDWAGFQMPWIPDGLIDLHGLHCDPI
jgi:hypothetical protein